MGYREAITTCAVAFVLGFVAGIAGVTVGILGMPNAGSVLCLVSCGCMIVAGISWKEAREA